MTILTTAGAALTDTATHVHQGGSGLGAGLTTLLIIVTGLIGQWIAWRVRIPAIIVLITLGLVLGPLSTLWGGWLQIDSGMPGFESLVGFGVALILFEGGLDLELREFRRVGGHIGRLVILGPPIAWLLGATAAHYIGGLSWPVALVLGAMLVVTGPTVIQPLLRHAKLNQDSASLLKWEGIVNDPIGVLLAVLVYQYFIYAASDGSNAQVLVDLSAAIGSAVFFGGLGGWLIGKLYARGGVPEHLKAPLLFALVLLVYEIANRFQHEAGLLAVTLMGLVLGNMNLGELEDLQRFKENLSIILVSMLFIVLTASLDLDLLLSMNWRSGLLILAFLFLVRPVSIWLATIGAGMQRSNRLLVSWIAPRGIVAAATAGLFGPGLIAAGYADADQLLIIVFGVILVTVVAHGLSIQRVAKKLGLAAEHDGGLLLVGASPFTIALAEVLQKHDISVTIVDGSWLRLKPARLAGIDIFYGELLSERAKDWVSLHHLNAVLCGSQNHFYNALVCRAMAQEFGQHNVFQLPSSETQTNKTRRLQRQQRGKIAFTREAHFDFLNQQLAAGQQVQITQLTAEYTWQDLQSDVTESYVFLGVLNKTGKVNLQSPEQLVGPKEGEKVIYLSSTRD